MSRHRLLSLSQLEIRSERFGCSLYFKVTFIAFRGLVHKKGTVVYCASKNVLMKTLISSGSMGNLGSWRTSDHERRRPEGQSEDLLRFQYRWTLNKHWPDWKWGRDAGFKPLQMEVWAPKWNPVSFKSVMDDYVSGSHRGTISLRYTFFPHKWLLIGCIFDSRFLNRLPTDFFYRGNTTQHLMPAVPWWSVVIVPMLL